MSVAAIALSGLGLVLAAMLSDYATALGTRLTLLDTAQQAARAGANQLDLGALRRTGAIRLDPPRARAAAQRYLLAQDTTGTTIAGPASVRVSTSITITPATRALLRLGPVTYTATATAIPRPG